MSKPILPKAPKSAHTPGPWKMNGDNHVYGPQKQPTTICARVYEAADCRLIAAAPDLLRENEIAATSMRCIADHIAGDTYLGEFAGDLRMIALNLENVARRAQGEAQ